MKAKSLKQTFKILAINGVLFAVLACSNNVPKENLNLSPSDISYRFSAVDDETLEYEETKAVNLKKTKANDLKLIKTATVRYKVPEVKTATEKIKTVLSSYDAYISDLRFQNTSRFIENKFVIKVPKHFFEVLMDSVNNVAEFINFENVTTKDVTEEYVDVEARLKTKLEIKERYETILRKNAKTVKEILDTEKRLGDIQQDIESAQGRLKYLTNKVSYSTINVELYQNVEYKEKPELNSKPFLSKVKEGFTFGWDIVKGLLLGIINVWPIIILGLLIIYMIKKKIR